MSSEFGCLVPVIKGEPNLIGNEPWVSVTLSALRAAGVVLRGNVEDWLYMYVCIRGKTTIVGGIVKVRLLRVGKGSERLETVFNDIWSCFIFI